MLPSSIERNTALAQAALDHALYFLELGANDRAAAYYQFASQQLQGVVKNLTQPNLIQPHLTQPEPIDKYASQVEGDALPRINPFHN